MGPTRKNNADGCMGKYPCPTCQRSFDRKDVLSRHKQIHDRNRPPPKARRKACLSCSRSKIKCLGEQPSCSACIKRDLLCVYNPKTDQRAASSSLPSSMTGANMLTPSRNMEPSSSVDGSQEQDSLHENVSYAVESAKTFIDTGGTFLPDQTESMQQTPDEIPAWSQFDNMDFSSNLEWIFQSGDLDTSSCTVNPDFQFLAPSSSLFPGPQSRTSNGTLDAHETQISGSSVPMHLEDPENIVISGLPTPCPQDSCSPDDPWPMEWHAGPAQKLTLTPLEIKRDGSRASGFSISSFYAAPSVSRQTVTNMQRAIRLPANMSPWSNINLDNFPEEAKLNHCIDLYFAHFHPTLPIIHRPTFDPKHSIVVTLAVVSIGVLYSEFAEAASFSNTLSEFTRRLLIFMAEHDRRFVRTETYITAQLLQGSQGYCNGNERLFELSESNRSSLVHNAKCMGLFRLESSQPMARPDANIHDPWLEWIRRERLLRLGWAVYEYDSSVSFLHNSRPFLSTSDVNMTLPSAFADWEAETSQSWAALHPWTNSFPIMPQLKPLIRTLFDGSERAVEKILNERHRLIIILTLVRMVWTLKEIRGSPINDLVENGLDDGRETLLRALKEFQSTSPEKVMATTHRSISEEVVRQINLIHIGHLYGAGDLMNWLYPLLRSDRTDSGHPGDAALRMQRWSLENPQRVREVIYHCGQIMGLARRYPTNMPFQPFAIFHAGVVLFFTAGLLPTSPQTHEGLRIDRLTDPQVADPALDWVRSGHPALLALQGVPALCSKRGGQQVLEQTADLLGQRHVWGIAQKFARVVLQLRDNAEHSL